MTENMKIAINAINKWNFFCWNYESALYEWGGLNNELRSAVVPVFLTKVRWTCNFDHMLSKWEDACRTGHYMTFLPKFYAELDTENRKALLEWVMMNYNGEKQL